MINTLKILIYSCNIFCMDRMEDDWFSYWKKKYEEKHGKLKGGNDALAALVSKACGNSVDVRRGDFAALRHKERGEPTHSFSDTRRSLVVEGLMKVFEVSSEEQLLHPGTEVGPTETEPTHKKRENVGEFSTLLRDHQVQFVAILRRGRIIAHDFDTTTIHNILKEGAEEWMDLCRRNCAQLVDSFDKTSGALEILGQGLLIRLVWDVEEGSFMVFPLPFSTRVFAAVLVEGNVPMADDKMKRVVESVWEQRSGVIRRKYTR